MKKRKEFSRYTATLIIMVIIFTAILSRLAYLQIVKYEDNKEQANNKSVRQIPEPAPRGNILDKNGAVLATSIQSYVLVFMETDESKKDFFTTMSKTFKMLDEQGEKLQDGFALKVNPFRFEFNTSDPDALRYMELRFKKDRGFEEKVINHLYPKRKDDTELTVDQQKKVDEELLNISAEDVFYTLVKDKSYQLYKLLGYSKEQEKALLDSKPTGKDITNMLLKKYSLEDIRRFMLVKDAIKMQTFSGFNPVVIANNLKRDNAFIFLQKLNELPGIDVTIQPIRSYPYNDLASSVIGYIGAIDSGQKDKYEERGYDISTDYIGKSGIESAFEDRLRGSKGGTTVKVNQYGRKTDELFKLEPSPGQNIKLTIDKELQYVAEKALEDTLKDLQTTNRFHANEKLDTGNATRGAVVVEDVNTGAILAMVSKPGYDPNVFSVPGRLTPELIKQYFTPDLEAFGKEYIKNRGLSVSVDDIFPLSDPKNKNSKLRDDKFNIYPKPFYNYATMGSIPPGSTFKPLTAVAGLEEGVIDQYTKIYDEGIFNKYEGFKSYQGACDWYNEKRGSHGNLDVKQALEYSCNYFFYEVGYRLYKGAGLDKLAEYAWKFGLGKDPNSKVKSTTGIEISEDTSGQVFNYGYAKQLVATLSSFNLVDMLNSGISSKGNKFTSIDISKNSEDSEELAAIKADIKASVREKLMKDFDDAEKSKLFNEMYEEMQVKFQKFIGLLPEEKKNMYSKTDINAICYSVANFVYFDKRTEITTPANVTDASIGQGMDQFTPLQLTNYISTLVNGGTRYRTRLVDKILDANGNVVEDMKPEVLSKINLKQSTVDTVKEGMRKVDETGTAKIVFGNFPIASGGKTGTATYKEKGEQEKIGRAAYGVYVGFAPYDKPEIAVTVAIYDGGHGYFGANVVKAIYEKYFRERILQISPNYQFQYDYKLDK